MQKYSALLKFIIVLFTLSISLESKADPNGKAKFMSVKQSEKLLSVPGLNKVILDSHGIPSYLSGDMGTIDPSTPKEDLEKFKSSLGEIFRMNASHSLSIKNTREDSIGMRHMRVQQYLNGKIVIGGELIFHIDASSNKIQSINGSYLSDLKGLPKKEKITSREVKKIAISSTGVDKYTIIQEPELAYTYNNDSVAKLVWYLTIEYIDTNSERQRNKILVDAISGEIVGIHPQIKNLLDREVWDAENTTNPAGITLIFDEGGASVDTSAIQAYNATGLAWDYFKTIHNIDSYDDAGHTIHSTVNYGLFTIDVNKAFWDGDHLVFGNGDGQTFSSLTNSQEVIIHEYTHAITDNTANLLYSNESGALNEAISDIFGVSAVAYQIGIDSFTWKLAEDAYTPGIPNDALRYMDNPTIDGVSKDYYPERYTGPLDSGGVHWNSGIANLAYYLLVQGGTHPRGKTTTSVSGIGMTKAEKIFFRALSFYMTSSETFEMVRNDTARAATDLYGIGSNEVEQLCLAWDAVGVNGQGTGYCNLTPDVSVTAEYIGCSPQNSPRYFVVWYAPGTILEYDANFKRNGSAWSAFYNGTQISAIYTDETYATSYIQAKARNINGWGSYDQVYLGPKSCNGGPRY